MIHFKRKGIFPAASFMGFQHAVFNFGQEPFKYPPITHKFENFNNFGTLNDEQKYVLPKYIIFSFYKRYKI